MNCICLYVYLFFQIFLGVVCEALSFVTHSSKANTQGKLIAEKLKENISRQQFEIIIQAKVGNKVSKLLII